MKKPKKRIFTTALAMVMILSAVAVSGCGNEVDSSQATVETTIPEETTTATEESSVEETTTSDVEEITEDETTEPTQETTKKANNEKKPSNSNSSSSAPKNVAVTSVSLSKSSMTITEGSSQSFEVYINPSSATDRQYNVVTNNGNATVNCNGSIVTVYAKNKGNCEITVSSNNGKSATCNVTVNAKTSSSSSSNNKPNNNSGSSNNNSGSNSNKNNQTITDDTLLTHAQICTDSTMKKVCDGINSYFINNLNMKYNGSLNKNNCGWFLSGTNYYLSDYYYTTNSIIAKASEGFEQELYALIDCDNWTTREDIPLMSFRCYYEKQSNGEYYIYFCHY